MRIFLSAFSLFVTMASVAVGWWGSGKLCRLGLCRSDQLFAAIDAQGITPASLSTLLEQDASNPMAWSAYAEALDRQGRTAAAAQAFEHAVSLGPRMPPVLMRAANFDFIHGNRREFWNLSRQILKQTDAFDGILFSYLAGADRYTPGVLGDAIPAAPRAAQAFVRWLRSNGSTDAVIQSWSWMLRNGLCDRPSAVEVAWALWERQSFQAAQQAWVDWMGPRSGAYLRPQRVANRRFENEPQGGPFDWSFETPPSVALARNHGLEVSFLGTENVAFHHLRQTAVVKPGRYRFAAEIQGDRLTTDQGPRFHIFDAIHPERFHAETTPVMGNVARSWTTVDFVVPESTRAVIVQLERHASDRLDRKISGTLHIYQISLLPAGSGKASDFADAETETNVH